MKKLFILSTFTCFLITSYGQEKSSLEKVYFQIGGGGMSNKGFFGEMSLNAALKKNWIVSLTYLSAEMEPKNLPSDYDPGYSFILGTNANPTIELNTVALTAGKYAQLARKVWFSAEAGLSVVNGEKLNFSHQQSQIIDWGPLGQSKTSNYSYTTEKKTTVGGLFKADMNWSFVPFAGIGFGVHANANSIQTSVGYEFKLMLGHFYKRNKNKKG